MSYGLETHYLWKKIELKSKKPDQIVWDEEQGEYIARLLPYAAQASGPVIKIPNIDSFKQKGAEKVSKQFRKGD